MYMKKSGTGIERECISRAAELSSAKAEDGKTAVTAYFIMGRSSNSRNRVFVEDGNGHPHPGI